MFEKIFSIGLLVQIIVLGLAMGYFLPRLDRKILGRIAGVYFVVFLLTGIVIRYLPFLVDPR